MESMVKDSEVVRFASGEAHRSVADHLQSLNRYLAGVARRFTPTMDTDEHSDFSLRIDIGCLLEFFSVTDDEAGASATMAWHMLALHTIVQDRRLDGDFTDPEEARGSDLLSNLLILDSLHLLAELSGHDPAFWTYAHAAFVAYAGAYAAESDLERYYCSPPDDRLVELVGDKLATVRIVCGALACLSGNHDRARPVEEALANGIFAGQIRDDIADWRDDHRVGKRTYVTLRLAERLDKPIGQCTDDELADELYLHGGLEEFVQEIDDRLNLAVDAVAGLPHSRLAGQAEELRRETQSVVATISARKSLFAQRRRDG